LQARAHDAFTSWMEAETRVVESLMSDASKMPEAFIKWMETVARDNPQKLKDFLSSLPSGLDTESRRASAALKAWLAEETYVVEELFHKLSQPSNVSSWPLLVFCFGAFMCLFSSAVYHMWVGYGQHTHDFMCRIDLGGISFMIWGSALPLVYYVFYNDPFTRDLYMIVGTILCTSTLILAALPAHILHKIKRTRVMSYVFAGAFAVLPLVHASLKWGWNSDEVKRYTNEGGLLLVAILYLVGTFVYISRFPESRFPGRFDLVGASHQVWHLLVLVSFFFNAFRLPKQCYFVPRNLLRLTFLSHRLLLLCITLE